MQALQPNTVTQLCQADVAAALLWMQSGNTKAALASQWQYQNAHVVLLHQQLATTCCTAVRVDVCAHPPKLPACMTCLGVRLGWKSG